MARRSLCATLTASGAPLRCATGHNLAALTSGGTDGAGSLVIRVWDLTCLGKPLLLSLENTSDVPHLAIGKDMNGDAILFAACSQYLRAWKLQRTNGSCPHPAGPPAQLELQPLLQTAGAAAAHAIVVEGSDARRLVLLVAAEAWVFDVFSSSSSGDLSLSLCTCLVGHASTLAACALGRLPSSLGGDAVLLSASEDRCFKLWSLPDRADEAAACLLESSLPPGSSIIASAAVHPRGAQFLIGDAGGTLSCFEIVPSSGRDTSLLGCRCTHKLDVMRSTPRAFAGGGGSDAASRSSPPRVVSSLPRWQQQQQQQYGQVTEGMADLADEAAELGAALLAISYVALPPREAASALLHGGLPSVLPIDDKIGGGMDRYSTFGVVVALPGRLLLLDGASWEALPVLSVAPPPSELRGDGGAAVEWKELEEEVAGGYALSMVASSADEGGGAAAPPHPRTGPSRGSPQHVGWILRSSAFQPLVRVWQLHAGGDDGGGAAEEAPTTATHAASAAAPTGPVGPMHGVPPPRAAAYPPPAGAPSLAGAPSAGGRGCSVLPTQAPVRGSPLARALAADLPAPSGAPPPPGGSSGGCGGSGGRGSSSGAKGSGGGPENKPVTFHRKVASSGYGKPPVMKLHAGGPSTAAAAAARASAALNLGRGAAALVRKYTPADAPMTHLQTANSAAAPSLLAPLLRMAFAPDASRLALAAADGSVSLLRLPARRHYASAAQTPPALAGHRRTVHSAAFSFSGRLLLTASADGTACVWDVAPDRPPAAPLLQLEHSLHSPKPGASAAEAAANPKFAGEVRAASFFYLDRLLLLANANALHLYSYALQKQPTHDAARAPELRHRYKLAHRWPLPRAQTVTCLAAANSFLSPIALAAGSDHTLCAIDLGVGACVCEIEEAHARPIHTLRLHEGSAHGETPSAGHDLVLSAALDGAVKLWDLRSASCVRKFEAHTNRTTPLGAALSPCLRFVCCGSEDRSAYLYDARGGGLIERLRHSEVVSDAAFSPLHPQLAIAGLDGNVKFFADRPEAE